MDPHPTGCPNCESGTLSQDFTEHRVIGLVKGSPTTVGQQAELNAARAGREQMEKMWETDKARVSDWKGKLPKGASINKTGTGETPPWRDGSFGTDKLDKPLDLETVKDVTTYVATGQKT